MFAPHASARQRPVDPSQMYAHSRTRTTSSNVFPNAVHPPQHPAQQPPQPPPPQLQFDHAPMTHAQRSASVNTFSTVSSGSGMTPPAAYRTSPSESVRRSTSSRSGGAPAQQGPQTSYVALLRRQKATVWSERAQFEDPRILAQQRAARMRANREIIGSSGALVGGPGGSRTGTGLGSAGGKVAAKIRHHGAKTTLGFGADSNYVGIGGVPLRLSATEVEPEDSEDEDFGGALRPNHRRTGSSGRNSIASSRRNPPYRTSTGALVPSAASGSNSLQGGARRYSPGDTPERTGSLVDDNAPGGGGGGGGGGPDRDDAASGKARSTASGSSAERADNVPDLGGTGRMPANSTTHAALTRERSTRNPEDLRRRGSVDERTMTMSTGRLFIANPD